jgi:polyhydroxyalkanoate synthesis regulator phasin
MSKDNGYEPPRSGIFKFVDELDTENNSDNDEKKLPMARIAIDSHLYDPLDIIIEDEPLPLDIVTFADRAKMKLGTAFDDDRPSNIVARDVLQKYPVYSDKVQWSDYLLGLKADPAGIFTALLEDIDKDRGTLAELVPDLIKLGTLIHKAGHEDFDEWAEEVRQAYSSLDDNLSEKIKPFLGKIYELVLHELINEVKNEFEELKRANSGDDQLPDKVPYRVEKYHAEYERLNSDVVLTDGEFEVEGLNSDGAESLPDLSDHAVAQNNSYNQVLPEWAKQYLNPESIFVHTLPDDPVFPTIVDNYQLIATAIDKNVLSQIVTNRDLVTRDESLIGLTDGELLAIWGEAIYNNVRRDQDFFYTFFLEHFPPLVRQVVELTLYSAQLRAIARVQDITPRDEDIILGNISRLVRSLEKRIESIAGFYPQKRGRKQRMTAAFLEKNILRAARELLEETGKVPKRPEIAKKLGKSDFALGRQLQRYGLTWRKIKDRLKNEDKIKI